MRSLLVAVALLAACRGSREARKAPKDAGRDGPALRVSVVPKLPVSEDGERELRNLDRRIEHEQQRATAITLRLERAAIRGRVDDYQRALADSARLVAQSPRDEHAWRLRLTALMRVHEFAAARDALAELAKLVHPSHLVEHEIALAHALGDRERALAGREALAKEHATAVRLTLWAATLAEAGRFEEAVALVPKAAAAVRDNPPQLLAWLLFQWGRIYEQNGEQATAREFFAAAHARMPGYVEATAHFAQAMAATGDPAGARALVDKALAANRHPELLALAAQLGRAELVDEARTAWERYVAALPRAFADHAARFYLGPGKDPKRALELARMNHANRDALAARVLVVDAALAANDAASACAVVEPLIEGTRAEQFVAYKALARCGRSDDAERVARRLGI